MSEWLLFNVNFFSYIMARTSCYLYVHLTADADPVFRGILYCWICMEGGCGGFELVHFHFSKRNREMVAFGFYKSVLFAISFLFTLSIRIVCFIYFTFYQIFPFVL
jgi:hypothetical protein